MMAQSPDDNILQRLNALERENRHLKFAFLGLTIGVVVLSVVGHHLIQTSLHDIVTQHQIFTSLEWLNVRGLTVGSGGISLRDSRGHERIHLAPGEESDPRIRIQDQSGKTCVALGHDKQVGGTLIFADAESGARLMLFQQGDSAALHFWGKNSKSQPDLTQVQHFHHPKRHFLDASPDLPMRDSGKTL